MGSQVPRYNTTPEPEGFVDDHGEDAVWYAAKYHLVADPWQETVCKSWLRTSADGRRVCSVAGITVARQNGKNGSLEIIQLYGMTQLGLKFLHTAHEVKTAQKAFARLKHFFGEKANDPDALYPELNALVKTVRNVNGQEAIILKNGGSVEFVARSKGSGRGFTVDVLVLDEAQDLTDEQLEALLPTISAAPQGNPLTIYMGTPPAADELSKGNGLPFLRVRNNALQGHQKAAWVEFGAPGFVEDMTPEELRAFVQLKKHHAAANPAYGRRILPSTIEGELGQFSPESFARERLNMWPKASEHVSAIPQERWSSLGVPLPDAGEADSWQTAAFGVDMNPERNKVSISVSSFPRDPEKIVLEMAASAEYDAQGTPKLVAWLWEHAKRVHPVVIDGESPARSLVPHLRKKKMKVFVMSGGEMVEASMGIYDAVMRDKTIEHFSEPRLDTSVAGVLKKFVDKAGKQFKFVPADMTRPFHPFMSALCAHYGAVKFARRRAGESEDESEGAFG